MTDVVDTATRSRMMAGIKGKDTKPEIFLRKALHALGFRYRLGGRGLPGKPDIVFPSCRAIVFVNGCFWHGHHCEYFKWPKTNPDFWKSKIEANVKRDIATIENLEAEGWRVITVWECELRKTKYQLPNRRVLEIAALLRSFKAL